MAGPAVTPDGTVVLANREGKVVALHADGSAYWNRQLPTSQTINGTPAVGGDGSVYVVGSTVMRDHREGATGNIGRAFLHRFTPGGGAPPASITPFPHHTRGPATIGAPNVWRFGADEAVIVPALYPTLGGVELHVIAFSPDGGVMAEWSEFLNAGDVSEGGSWTELLHALPFLGEFVHGELGSPGASPFPGAAIAPHVQGGTPIIAVVDRYSSRTIAFRFCVGPSCSPAAGFNELSRTDHAPRVVLTGPTILPDLYTVVGTRDGVAFAGPSPNPPSPIGLDKVYTTPTLTADGRIIVVNVKSEAIALQGGGVASRVHLGGVALARAAASRTHVFVATSKAFYTMNADASSTLFTFPGLAAVPGHR